MKAIIVTGTPGTGKTTVAKKIAARFKLKYLDVNRIISENNLSIGHDQERGCEIVDVKQLSRVLSRIVAESKERLVIDSHLSHCIPKDDVSVCVATKCKLSILEDRLKRRGYNKDKVRENLDSEIFDICRTEAEENGHTVIVINTDDKIILGRLEKFI